MLSFYYAKIKKSDISSVSEIYSRRFLNPRFIRVFIESLQRRGFPARKAHPVSPRLYVTKATAFRCIEDVTFLSHRKNLLQSRGFLSYASILFVARKYIFRGLVIEIFKIEKAISQLRSILIITNT